MTDSSFESTTAKFTLYKKVILRDSFPLESCKADSVEIYEV